MFKNGHYIDSGLPQEVRNKIDEQTKEKNKKLKSWNEIPPVNEDQNDEPHLIERLRNGEKIKCVSCKKGIYITNAKDIKTSHGFFCNNCNFVIHVDPPIEIE